MVIKEFFVSLAIALLICVVYALITRRGVRRTGFGWFLLFMLLATWAGGVWLRPFGPIWGHIRWLQFLIAGLAVLLILALFAPHKAPRGRQETIDQLQEIAREKEVQKVTYVTLGIVFWVILVMLIAVIAIRYISL